MNKNLVDILACPKCKGPIVLEEETRIVCHGCCLIYPIRDGIPVMLIDEAVDLEK